MNTTLFPSAKPTKKAATIRNAAGGRAYDPGSEAGLAQMAMTCTLADSYYTSSEAQLAEVLKLADACTPEYVAQLAVYSREVGQMKDLPVVLLCNLFGRFEQEGVHALLDRVFPRVIDNGRMVRNFVQAIRSGRFGRRALGSQPKRLLRNWFRAAGADGVFAASVGSNPSMADCLRLARPVPNDQAQKDMYRYLVGKGEPAGAAWLLKKWSLGEADIPRGLPFEFLAGAATTNANWEQIAHVLSWNGTLKNLNTFARHKVSPGAWKIIEERLGKQPPRHVFPYSVMTAYKYIESNGDIPMSVKVAVQRALDSALSNIPSVNGSVAVLVDVSGSMQSPVTGYRGSATAATTCVEVAALVASAILKRTPDAKVVQFDTDARGLTLNPLDSVVTNASKISARGGGTDVSCGIRFLNQARVAPDLTVIVSDNQSWFENMPRGQAIWNGRSFTPVGVSGAQSEWDTLASRNKNAKLVCLDVQANPTVQVQSSRRVLNLGGFSDQIFKLIADFYRGSLGPDAWAQKIKETEL